MGAGDTLWEIAMDYTTSMYENIFGATHQLGENFSPHFGARTNAWQNTLRGSTGFFVNVLGGVV